MMMIFCFWDHYRNHHRQQLLLITFPSRRLIIQPKNEERHNNQRKINPCKKHKVLRPVLAMMMVTNLPRFRSHHPRLSLLCLTPKNLKIANEESIDKFEPSALM